MSVVWRGILCGVIVFVIGSGSLFALSPVESALSKGESVTSAVIENHYSVFNIDETAFWENMKTLSATLRDNGSSDLVSELVKGIPSHWSIEATARVHVQHSYDLMSFAKFQIAFELLEQRVDDYLRWKPSSEIDITSKANLLHIYGQLLVRKNRISLALSYFYEAEAMFRDLDENHPSIFTIKVILGEAFLAARRYKEASNYLNQAQRIFPEKRLDGRSYVAGLEVKSYLLAGELEQAKMVAETYLANPIDPRRDYFLFFSLAYLEVLRQIESYAKYEAVIEETYELAEEIGNEDYLLEVSAHQGFWYLINTRYADAIRVLETVTQGETDIRDRVHLNAYVWLVEAYRSLGQYQEALATQTTYIELLSLEYEEINQKAIEEVSSSFRLAAAESESKNAELERGLEEERRVRAQLATWILVIIVIGLIVSLTFVVSILILLRRKTKTLNEIAWVDPLTGVGNRLLMGEDAQKRLPNFVALIDIDYLKYYNDQFGHARGDELLIYFAQKLKAMTAELSFTSHVYRIGGDEFVVTAEQGDQSDFEACIKSIDQAIREEGFSKAGLSYGIAKSSEYSDFSEALSKADARMYQMKSNRKNNRQQQEGR